MEYWTTKGLIEYDANVYQREMNDIITQITAEMGTDMSNFETYEAMGIYVEDLENMQRQRQMEESNEEANNIEGLGEHFMDGCRQEDEIENDFE